MSAAGWLTARPVAHRGLHDERSGIIENTAAAFAAAIEGNFGIECDLQVSADGEAIVHHDEALGRLTEGDARIADLTAAELRAVRFRAGDERLLTLGELCDLVAGRVPLLIELKSRFDGDDRLARRAAEVLGGYRGPAAVMSFDPAVVARLRARAPGIVRGIVAERRFDWDELSRWQRFRLAHLLHGASTRPHFVAYAVRDLPAPAPLLARRLFGLPLLAWTVRSLKERRRAARWADQVIFEGWRP